MLLNTPWTTCFLYVYPFQPTRLKRPTSKPHLPVRKIEQLSALAATAPNVTTPSACASLGRS